MENFYYPLPRTYLIKRYAPLFEIIRKRQSGSFIGLPESAKSGYLRFLLEEKKIIKSLLHGFGTTHKILYFEPLPISITNPYHWLFQLSIKLEAFDSHYKHPASDDPIVILTNIQKYILRIAQSQKHFTIIISSPEVWKKLPREAALALRSIWDISRKPPNNPCSLIFLCDFLDDSLINQNKFFSPISDIMYENISYFPLMNFEETNYTIRRFQKFLHVKNIQHFVKKIYRYTGGYYEVVVNIVKICNSLKTKVSLSLIRSCANNTLILKNFTNIWNALDNKQRQKFMIIARNIKTDLSTMLVLKKTGLISQENKINSLWFKYYVHEKKYQVFGTKDKKTEKEYFTGKEYLVFEELLLHSGEVVTREKFAEILWTNLSKEKYSDWAIDQLISRIRKKLNLHNSDYSLITIKKQGYILTQ
jgi:DNA-binding winged helix-turn-helix (wHTH) protein